MGTLPVPKKGCSRLPVLRSVGGFFVVDVLPGIPSHPLRKMGHGKNPGSA